MVGAWEYAHVHPDLRYQNLRYSHVDPWDGVQPLRCLGKRGHSPFDLLAAPLDGFIQIVDVGELLRQEEAVNSLHLPLKGLLQLRDLLAQCAPGSKRQCTSTCSPASADSVTPAIFLGGWRSIAS